ncbi:MAG: class I SAM-dependent DNA methyltransferase [Candidatus Hodarchaeota archaeon]
MQAYSRAFARVYNRYWTDFAKQLAPKILEFYEKTPLSGENKIILDLCCGTGQLAVYFLENGYEVIGVDLSEGMLHYARENASAYIENGKAEFIKADAADFKLNKQVGLVISAYDSLNHLENFEALSNCFQSVYEVLVNEGYFIFDLNTRGGLLRWNRILIQDEEDVMIVNRGIYDISGKKAWMKISGFIKSANGFYERFDETAFNSVFECELVRKELLEIGWKDVYFAQLPSLDIPIENPEKESRIFFVAKK